MSSPAATSATVTSSGIYAVPKLTEKNWVEFKTKSLMSLSAQGLAHHLNGTVRIPQSLPVDPKDGKIKIADKSQEATEDKIEANAVSLNLFNQKEALAIQQLYATVPNSVMIQVQHHTRVANIWKAI
ncbi:hypothetical protein J3A83DRAFT_4107239 [Scleroderma citrinum]